MNPSSDKDKKTGHPAGHEWEDTSFGWDNMKDGIYGKILEEDPLFFKKKRRRPVPVWFCAGATIVMLGGIGFFLINGEDRTAPPPNPIDNPTQKVHSENKPIAEESEQTKLIFEKTKTQDGLAIDQDTKNVKTHNPVSLLKANSFVRNKAVHQKVGFINDPSKPIVAGNEDTGQIKFSKLINNSNSTTLPPPVKLDLAFNPLIVNPTFPHLSLLAVSLENEENDDNKKGRWKVAATGGSLFSFSKYFGTSAATTLRNNNTSPYFGYQYGVDVWMPLNGKSFLLFGVGRQVGYQNIDIYTQREADTLIQNTLLEVTHFVVGSRSSNTYGDTIVQGVQNNRLVHYNQFKTVQLQIGFARIFTNKNWTFSPFVGIAVGLFTNSEGRTVAADKSIFEFNNDNPIFNRFQFKTMAGLEVGLKLSEKLSLLARYSFDKQWNNASMESDLVLRPASHYLSIGVSKQW